MKQQEIPFGILMLGDDLREKVTTILVELKKRYDKEMEFCKPEQYGHLRWDLDSDGDDHEDCFRQNHRDTATAYAHAYSLVVKTFKLTEREAWSLIKPYLQGGS
jgi:hypothetical protein